MVVTVPALNSIGCRGGDRTRAGFAAEVVPLAQSAISWCRKRLEKNGALKGDGEASLSPFIFERSDSCPT
jgi:hypothetical protein